MKSVYRNKKLSSAGFTLIETGIALAITAVVVVFGSQIMIKTSSSFNRMNSKVSGKIDEKLGERILLKDVRLSSPSMNTIKIRDDSGLSFYDYDPDKTSRFSKAQKQVSRTVTLKKDGNTKFYVLISDESRGKALYTDAISFFEIGPSPSSILTASELIYRGLNFKNYLTVNGQFYLNEKQLILVDSSSTMVSAKSHAGAQFLGLPKTNGTLVDLAKVQLPDDIFTYGIMEENQKEYTPNSFQEYLINIPAAGVNGASVRLKGVKLLKYELECSGDDCDLYRSEISLADSTLDRKNLMLKGCKMVTFSRENTSETIFKLNVVKADIK